MQDQGEQWKETTPAIFVEDPSYFRNIKLEDLVMIAVSRTKDDWRDEKGFMVLRQADAFGEPETNYPLSVTSPPFRISYAALHGMGCTHEGDESFCFAKFRLKLQEGSIPLEVENSFPLLHEEQKAFLKWIENFRQWILLQFWAMPDFRPEMKNEMRKTQSRFFSKHTPELEKMLMESFLLRAENGIVKRKEGSSAVVKLNSTPYSRKARFLSSSLVETLPKEHYIKKLEEQNKFYLPPRILAPTGEVINLGLNEEPLLNEGDFCVTVLSMRVYTQRAFGTNAKIHSVQPFYFAPPPPKKRDISSLLSSNFMDQFSKRFKTAK